MGEHAHRAAQPGPAGRADRLLFREPQGARCVCATWRAPPTPRSAAPSATAPKATEARNCSAELLRERSARLADALVRGFLARARASELTPSSRTRRTPHVSCETVPKTVPNRRKHAWLKHPPPARQAGGHWFEPSIAHPGNPAHEAGFPRFPGNLLVRLRSPPTNLKRADGLLPKECARTPGCRRVDGGWWR